MSLIRVLNGVSTTAPAQYALTPPPSGACARTFAKAA